jgi:ring-1,2-phenylacetyl-CoA epoxidase subunit PaaE
MEPFQIEVTDIQPAAKDCATIFFKRVDGLPLDYHAGQFLTFLLTLNGREIRRSYSFSSAPGKDEFLSITVKRVVNGAVSRYLLDHLGIGDRLLTLPPSGRFTLDEDSPRSIFFIAAGSGMVPVFSLLKQLLAHPGPAHAPESPEPPGKPASETHSRIVLITQQHDKDSILFRSVLQQWQQDHADSFQWINLLTVPDRHVVAPTAYRLNNFLLEKLLLEWNAVSSPLFYLCGPPSFMRMAQFTLRLMGIGESLIRKEHFTVEYVPPPPLLSDTLPKKITLLRNGQIIVFETVFPMTILQAALAHQVALPYSCRGGRCSTCVARCLKGKVKMSINEVLTDQDLKEGLVLTCVGYAETDIELSFE